MNSVFLEIGGNLGDKRLLLEQARSGIAKSVGVVVKSSGIYETPPWGFEHTDNFYNQVLLVKTNYNPQQVLERTNVIEEKLGRMRSINQFAPRTMDIDILFFNNNVVKTERLIIPHPRLHLRKFVLVPMHELAPDLVHPVLQKNIAALLANCDDNSVCTLV